MYEQLINDSHNFKLPINVSALLHNDTTDSVIVFYYVSEGDYKHISILNSHLWDFIVERNYNIDYSFYVNGEQRNIGRDAGTFVEYVRFWQPDLSKIASEFINEYLPNGRIN